ncbi:hypothetical protein [Vibrio algicola]|uniref:Uncharacterized protein n=1 Tax=Vibrio algicola TaxID=2662262 RepID=A0A5Q0TCD4_9VIBR|nr:hypothetical protein [Vibrio algicola]
MIRVIALLLFWWAGGAMASPDYSVLKAHTGGIAVNESGTTVFKLSDGTEKPAVKKEWPSAAPKFDNSVKLPPKPRWSSSGTETKTYNIRKISSHSYEVRTYN